jgi:YHS domain-containing protein
MTKTLKAVLVAAIAISACTAFAAEDGAKAKPLPKDANSTCPVMMKEKTKADMFTDYKGQRVYFCCAKCKKHFAQDPDKYMTRLNEQKAKEKAETKPKA